MITIYGLSDGPDGPVRYIGASAKDAAYILSHHRSAAKSAKKRTPVNEWVLATGASVSFTALESVSAEDKADRLVYWIDYVRANGDVLNVTPEEHAVRVKEAMATPEVRQRISDNGRGRVNSPAHREAISRANKGRVISEEHRDIIRRVHTGKVISPETREKIAAKARGHQRNAGRVHTQAARDKMSHTRHVNLHEATGTPKAGCRWCFPTT